MKRLALLPIVALMIAQGCAGEKIDERSLIIFFIGDVKKNKAVVQIGDLVKEKDLIQTGADSFCDIKIGESLVRIKQNTKVLMSALVKKGAVETTSIDLDSGKLLCKPKKLMRSESFLIKTPTAVAGVRGTQFTVETDAERTSRIKVFEGQVKVVKRIKNLEGRVDELLNEAPAIDKNEKITITKLDVEKTEKLVDRIMEAESGRGDKAAFEAVINRAGKDIFASQKDVRKFSVEDFAKDNKEIIDVKEKSPEVVKKINTEIKKEKETPQPAGRLLVTKYEVYFIKDGRVDWEGTVVEEPKKLNDRLYIASGEYIFCSSLNGPVLWRKKLENEGRLLIRDNKLIVPVKGREMRLDLKTGEAIKSNR
jgi:hypothetical protein